MSATLGISADPQVAGPTLEVVIEVVQALAGSGQRGYLDEGSTGSILQGKYCMLTFSPFQNIIRIVSPSEVGFEVTTPGPKSAS